MTTKQTQVQADVPSTLAAGSVSGIVASECRSIEPWIVNAARELAMDSTHVPLIARIIERNAPTSNTKLRRGGPDNNNLPGDPPSPGVIG